MRKIYIFFAFTFAFITSCVYAELDWDKISDSTEIYSHNNYSVELLYYTPSTTEYNSVVFFDNISTYSNIEIAIQSMPLNSKLQYSDVYTEHVLDRNAVQLLNLFKQSFYGDVVLKDSKITTLNDYACFWYLIESKVTENASYYTNYYAIYSDNYLYEISINSDDENYLSYARATNFLKSFKIKDSLSLCTTPTTSKIDNKIHTTSSKSENFFFIFIVDIVLTASIYLFIPLLIRFGFKNSFTAGIALVISSINFTFIKILLNVIWMIPMNASSAWLYLFIGQAILTKSKINSSSDNKDSNSENKKETDDILTAIISKLD